jgi:hypothetical protein
MDADFRNAYAEYDSSLHPVVIARIKPIEPTPQEFDQYIQAAKEVIRNLAGGVMVFNVSDGKFLSSEQRIKLGKLFKDEREALLRLKGMAYVNAAIIPMTMLKAIFLVNKPPVDYTVVSTEADAISWAKKKLSEL